MRIDKFLWSVRVFKTRTIATEACKKGKILISDIAVKPSRIVKLNESIIVNKNSIMYSYQIKEFPKSRVGAKLVATYIDDITPAEELEKLDLRNKDQVVTRDRGAGRPTKKDRRVIDKYFN